jgi:hypothetical protein
VFKKMTKKTLTAARLKIEVLQITSWKLMSSQECYCVTRMLLRHNNLIASQESYCVTRMLLHHKNSIASQKLCLPVDTNSDQVEDRRSAAYDVTGNVEIANNLRQAPHAPVDLKTKSNSGYCFIILVQYINYQRRYILRK